VGALQTATGKGGRLRGSLSLIHLYHKTHSGRDTKTMEDMTACARNSSAQNVYIHFSHVNKSAIFLVIALPPRR
jgi:hypothetical protein